MGSLSLLKILGPGVLWNSECFEFIKLIWCIYHILCNAPEGLRQLPIFKTFIFLQRNMNIHIKWDK